MKILHGIVASRGIAIGPVFQFKETELLLERRQVENTETEKARFLAALDVAREQLKKAYVRAEREVGARQSAIFKAQLLMLEDPELIGTVQAIIERERINAESALFGAAERYAQLLEALDDENLRSRALDVRDVATRVIRVLLNISDSPTAGLTTPSVILARDLTPSDTVFLDKSLVLGFCTASGGAMSHTAILARELGLPAVVGVGPEVLEIPNGTFVILDGINGTLLVEPDEETVSRYRTRQFGLLAVMKEAWKQAHGPAVTLDGHRVKVMANIGNLEGAKLALEAGAEGVGLLRTEFLYLERNYLPSEEELYQAYRAIAEAFGNQPVVLRTLDIGGDKKLPYLGLPDEMNPFLGLRAIRLCLARPDLFRPQLRAALRAGARGNLKVMFPMVTTLEEVREARLLLESCRDELKAEGKDVAEKMEIGIMVEVPAAALMADRLADEVDFFSIGTNDLSQYTLAADRTNAQVANLASAFHPAVLRLVQQVVQAAHLKGKWVGLCGEMAGEPLAIPILLGLGLDELSMSPFAIPVAKRIIRALTMEQAREIAHLALEMDSAKAVQEMVQTRFHSIIGE